MKKILIINQSVNYLTENIASTFVESLEYEEVVLMAGNPHDIGQTINPKVKIVSMSPYIRSSFKTRLVSWIKGTWDIVRAVRKSYKGYELFLVSNPPTVAFATMFFNNRYSTLIYDVYPNGLTDAGFISKSNPIYKIWAKRNKYFYKRADRVFTITEGMRRTISDYCSYEKIEVVELWGNPNLPVFNIPKKENRFILENGLKGKFIVMYSGNIGKGHDLDVLVDVAEHLKKYKDIVFLFVGEGFLKPLIAKKVEEKGLENVKMLPYQDMEMLPYSLSCSDIAVVSTNKQSGKVCIPSKTFDLIKLGKPILCVAEPDSDIAQFVAKQQVGESFSREQIVEMVDFITTMYNNPEKLLSYEAASIKASNSYTSAMAKGFL